MRVTLLGTGGSAGVPMIGGADGSGDWGTCDPAEARNRRTRSSIVIEPTEHGQSPGAPSADGLSNSVYNPYIQRVLIDTSPDMREQFITHRIPGADAVLFTHAHADHITGIDDVRILNRIAKRPLDAFATERTLDEIIRRFGYAFAPWDGRGFYRPVLTAHRVAPGDTVRISGLDIRLFRQGHGRVETLGLRVGPFAYSTDVIDLDEAAFETLAGVDTWVVGCFLRHDHHWTHANLPTVFDWVARIQPRRTVLTHMGPDMDWAWLNANLPAGIEAGYDGMVLEFSPVSSTAASPETPGRSPKTAA